MTTDTLTCSRCGSTEDVADHTNSAGETKRLCLECFDLLMAAAAERMIEEREETLQ